MKDEDFSEFKVFVDEQISEQIVGSCGPDIIGLFSTGNKRKICIRICGVSCSVFILCK